ncbi:MAG: hypothetical protein LBS26_06105 [Campylobacteraceae bacterium]|jgi:hypothetical protein|nr:hypothetical protein [Campylobacteraceae bacterium]
MHDKKELESYKDIALHVNNSDDSEKSTETNLSLKFLLYTYAVMIVGFLLLLPMIYIKNQIYYHSRDINALWSEYFILMEENRDLNQKIKIIRFKKEVLDPLDVE